ncbi:MAG: capsular polysaccharide biosynthesis protein, partial [Siculibacillus sp.]|nr:capsular polysaccharide biosynthesis protein [Siculibacillus sp.]
LRPNDFEAAVVRRAAAVEADHGEIRSALDAIRDLRLSKYNHAPMRTAAEMGLPAGRDVVLVVDQTFGDASIGGAAADGASFVRMLDAAIAENPGAPIAVKIHPEAISGTKRGYLAEVARRRGVIIVGVDVNPWALIETARRVYTVSSQFGMEALLAGVPVTSFGAAFYAGWGLTDDRFAPSRRRTVAASREALAEAAYVDYCRWLDPWDGRPIDLASAIDRLAFLRDRFHENTASVCVGFSRWKRRSTRRFLAGIGGEPRFVGDEKTATAVAEASGARIVVWGNRAFADASRPVVRAEDGFLRSVGLGAAFVAPASLVFDAEGMYYDPRRACGFETLATETTFGPDLVARAARLRETIVAQRLSKYNESGERRLDFPPGAIRILVPGQVEDDASVRFGSPMVPSNLELLRRVRARWPAAHILYKPHPDVHAGYRAGAIPEAEALRHADRIVTDVSMPSLLAQVDRVETMTSLTGFEALLRGLPVATHGIPFYAGWGLCEDLAPCERRRRRLALDELVAVALILYPRYIDPATGLPAPVEVVVERLIHGREAGESPLGRLTRRLRHRYAWVAHNVLGPLVGLFRRP